jgi:hypothetical protein
LFDWVISDGEVNSSVEIEGKRKRKNEKKETQKRKENDIKYYY